MNTLTSCIVLFVVWYNTILGTSWLVFFIKCFFLSYVFIFIYEFVSYSIKESIQDNSTSSVGNFQNC